MPQKHKVILHNLINKNSGVATSRGLGLTTPKGGRQHLKGCCHFFWNGTSIAPKEFKDQCKSNSRKPLINDDWQYLKMWKPV